jgi:hypothetical protein
MKKSSKITLIVLGIIFIVGLFFYYRLGGFNKPEITMVQAPAYHVAGKSYKGKMTTKEFGTLFKEAETFVEKKELAGRVSGIFYSKPEKENDTITAFVGVILDDPTQKLPVGYTIKEIPARKIIRATIHAHILVSPFIYPDIEDYAGEQKVELLHVPAVEIYISNSEMIIEVPVK